MPSLRTMRLNIWRALICASDSEIIEGMSFYHGAHGLCRFFSTALTGGILSPQQIAGIYAALSPLNGWETNVSNVVDVIRYVTTGVPYLGVNTPTPNEKKALCIACGEDVESIIPPHTKVYSFYRSIADPNDTSYIPVDRHLICLALCYKLGSNVALSKIVSDRQLLQRIESVYRDLGRRENLGNRLASIAWFVQRRLEGGQSLIPHTDSPFCCGRPMQSQGQKPRRFLCGVCGRSKRIPLDIANQIKPRRYKRAPVDHIDGFPVYFRSDSRCGGSRKIIYLGKKHPLANPKSGWQYVSRYLVMRELGEPLRADEHVDHIDCDKLNDRIDNFRVMVAESHGRHHVYLAELAGRRGPDGRFTKYEEPIQLGLER